MRDLTLLYYTANRLHPDFMKAVQANTQKVADAVEADIVSVSRVPMAFGRNYVFDREAPFNIHSVYRQMLMAAEAATTPWVASAEDDAFYAPAHFRDAPRDASKFWYDDNRWQLYAWKDRYCTKSQRRNLRPVAWLLFASRDLLIRTLTTRFLKHPNPHVITKEHWVEPGRGEHYLLGGTDPGVGAGRYRAADPSVVILHHTSLGYDQMGRRKKLQAWQEEELPYWGHVREMKALYRKFMPEEV